MNILVQYAYPPNKETTVETGLRSYQHSPSISQSNRLQ